ncbi:hypothetical protein ABL849_20350 [Variovorax sp. 375MFSha3.1]|uniref:hypothetical protein n=1 Tax=unclassified Variovorax TaxID=663243 RepID=UPI003AAFDC0D
MRIKLLASLLAFGFLVGCARSPVTPVQQAPVARVIVVPVAPIEKMHTENKGILLGVLWQSVADRIKSADFNERMEAARKDMGPKFTAALVRQLVAQGYEAQVVEGASGRPAQSVIDESKLPPTDAVLRVYLNEVGMFSARFSRDYVPRVNLSAYLVRGETEDSLYSETLYYGADATNENASWSVPANPDHHWSSFSELVEHPQEVAQSYDHAVNALATRVAQNIRAQVSPSTVVARSVVP